MRRGKCFACLAARDCHRRLAASGRFAGIPGLAERWGRSVFHRPCCHGDELQPGRIAVIAARPVPLHPALALGGGTPAGTAAHAALVLAA